MTMRLMQGGQWRAARYVVKAGNAIKQVVKGFVMVDGQWRPLQLSSFQLTLPAGNVDNYSVRLGFIAKYGVEPPAGTTIELYVPAACTVRGRAQSYGIKAPPAIDFDGVPLNCKAKIYVSGKVIGGAGAGGRTTAPFPAEPLENNPPVVGITDVNEIIADSVKRAHRENNADPGLITGYWITSWDQSSARKRSANAKMNFVRSADAGDGGDAIFFDGEVELYVLPGGVVAGGGGGGAGIGHGYTKLYHTPIDYWFSEPANLPFSGGQYIGNSTDPKPNGVVARLSAGQTFQDWDYSWYDTQGCKFVSHTLFHAIPGMPGKGAVPLDYPQRQPGETDADFYTRCRAYIGDSTHSGVDTYTSFLPDFAAHPNNDRYLPEAQRFSVLSNQTLIKGKTGSTPAQYAPPGGLVYYGVPSADRAQFLVTEASGLMPDFVTSDAIGYDAPSLDIRKFYGGETWHALLKTDGTQWGSTSSREANLFTTYGHGPHPLTAVGDASVTTRRVKVLAGKGGEYGADGAPSTAKTRSRTEFSRTLLPAELISYGAALNNASDPKTTSKEGVGVRAAVVDANAYALVSGRISGPFYDGTEVADLRDYLINSVPVSDKPVGQLSPAHLVPKEVYTPRSDVSSFSVSYRVQRPSYYYWDVYYPSLSYRYFAAQYLGSVTTMNYAPSAAVKEKVPGTFTDLDMLSTAQSVFDFSASYNVAPWVRGVFGGAEGDLGTPRGCYAGFPVQPCQIGLPGSAGKAVAGTGTFTVQQNDGQILGDVG